MIKFLILTLAVGLFSFAESPGTGHMSKEEHKAMAKELKDEKDAVDSACSAESKEAGCGDKTVGKGLLKCLHEHKKASKEFKISEGCHSAMKNLRHEKHRLKEENKK